MAKRSAKRASPPPRKSHGTPIAQPAAKEEASEGKLWSVEFTVRRVIEIRGATTSAEAEERARDQALFKDKFPLDPSEIKSISTGWVDSVVGRLHVDGCLGNHCWHYDCSDGVEWPHEDYHEYCANCDPE